MKKITLTLLASLLSISAFASNTLDLNKEFEYDQEQALVSLEKAWLKQEQTQSLLLKFSDLIRANSRFRQTLVGQDPSVVAKMLSAANKNKDLSSVEKLNEAMMTYFKDNKMPINTRDSFSSRAYQVER